MGRSVSYPSGAIVAFTVLEVEAEDDWEFEYEWLRDELCERAAEAFPSLIPHDGWRGREDRILMRNAYTYGYNNARDAVRGNDLFVTIRGRAPHKVRAHVVFVRLARQLGYRGPTGTAGMRLHDLRHTFAVRSLESCPPDREAIAHHMAGLSVYLGHASVANTYWYLEATPVLLRDIAAASEQLYRGEAA